MSFDTRLSPARVSAEAAGAFPRAALFALLATYILAGLLGRDPWYAEDAAGFGLMWSMAHGGLSDWLLPNVAHYWVAEEGPLASWVGAVLIKLCGPFLGEVLAARLTSVLWFAVSTSSLWYATYSLACREEAQPVSFVFGGEANARDYGRMLADIAVLLLMGTLGLVVRLHDMTAETAAFACVCLALYGAVRSLASKPLKGALITGAALAAVALARGPWPALWLSLGLALVLFRYHQQRQATLTAVTTALVVLVTFAVSFAVWPLLTLLAPASDRAIFFGAWQTWVMSSVHLPSQADLAWLARNFVWTTWPIWPLAAWTAYSWRHARRAPHVALPGVALIASLIAMLTTQPVNNAVLVLVIPPLLILAAFGATTLRRTADDLLDWFAIAVFSLFALAAWVYYFALITGTPPRMAYSVQRLVPGFSAQPQWLFIAIGVVASIAWLTLARWRVAQRPVMLWCGPVLAASGLTMLWLLTVTLFLPAVNYNRSYAPLALEVRQHVDELTAALPNNQSAGVARPACVQPFKLLIPHLAVFAYHGGLRFAPPTDDSTCPLLLHRDSRRSEDDNGPPTGSWQLVWQGGWPARPDESWRLYQRRSN